MSQVEELVITIRTDKPEAEIGVFAYGHRVSYHSWHAHRELAETLHASLRELLASNENNVHDVTAIVCYEGPGSFTGLRIGISVANALAYGLSVPVVAAAGEAWIVDGIERLKKGESSFPAQPFYGAPVHITAQKK